jgi:type IV pilus assembly protein PilP
VTILALGVACERGSSPGSKARPPQAPTAGQAAQPGAVAPAQEQAQAGAAQDAEVVQLAEYTYEATDKRDPFRSFVLEQARELAETERGPLEQFDLNQLTVTGVVWGTKRRRALISDPSGRGYVIREGTAIGKNDGRVIRIEDNLVLVRETYVDYLGDRTTKEIEMQVRQSQGG